MLTVSDFTPDALRGSGLLSHNYMKAQDKSMENFDEKYRRKILDEMQRKAMHSATHVKNMTNVFR